ncbi:unnamed protein product [Rotaria sp. Silwood2]|nr:unnamed protein product [Rotaria sp. Silwood2]CAF2760253.1 unnamed protein product [Rotaria sp. Silwood2]CAF4043343.1 unnamed protein product [Rotaria sp. Silwood2]CAF4177559.1 unnamed protein product [Rotaria sp. Silwood2]
MSANKTEVDNYSTINDVEYLTVPSIFTGENIYSANVDITSDTLADLEETYQHSLSNHEVDQLVNQLTAIDYKKDPLDQEDSNPEHIQNHHNVQIRDELDTTADNLQSPTPLSSDSATDRENSSPSITQEYPSVQSPIESPTVTVENWSADEISPERSAAIEQIQELIQRLAPENTTYTYDIPHSEVLQNIRQITTIIMDPHVYDSQNGSHIVPNEYVTATEPTIRIGNNNLQMIHMEPTSFSSITNQYHDYQVFDSNVNSESSLITYEHNDVSNTPQLIMDENGEYIEIPAEAIILPYEYNSTASDLYQSNVLHEEYIYN